MYAFSENFILVLSHDEVVHGKCSMINKMREITGKSLRPACKLRLPVRPSRQETSFHGGEFAQFIEWNYKQSLDWFLLDYDMHKKMQDYVRDLNSFTEAKKHCMKLISIMMALNG